MVAVYFMEHSMRTLARVVALLSVLWLAMACPTASNDVEFSADSADSQSQDPWTLRTSVDDEGRLIAEVTPKGKFRVNTDYPWVLTVGDIDRKSTRLNSSHVAISYAVFCLKKKKKTNKHPNTQ